MAHHLKFLTGNLLIVGATILFNSNGVDANVDCSYCKAYTPVPNDPPNYTDNSGAPLLYMGETYSKKYFMLNKNITANFFQAAFSACDRFGLQLATIKTSCEFCIMQNWFFSHYPTTYSAWIAGFRFGDNDRPAPLWTTTGEPLDFNEFGIKDIDYIGGPYPPGGYSPIAYPWVNCLTINRNCPLFTSGPTNPCEQSDKYPDVQFLWEDCRLGGMRVICEETSYTRNEIDR